MSIDSYNVEEYSKSMFKRVKNKGMPTGAEIAKRGRAVIPPPPIQMRIHLVPALVDPDHANRIIPHPEFDVTRRTRPKGVFKCAFRLHVEHDRRECSSVQRS